jgi:hypothetical protein
VPLALTAALAGSFVHGLASDGDSRVTLSGPARTPRSSFAPGEPAPKAEDSTTGRSSRAPNVTGNGRLTQAVASLTLRVDGTDDLSSATSSATRVARSLGGYAASVEYVTPAHRPGRAYLELRVPTARVQDALARLGGLGTIVSQRVSTRDLESQLERQTAQIQLLRREIRLLRTALRDPSLPAVQRVQLQVRLGEAKRALAQRTHARKKTISEGTLARISLVLTTAKQGAVATPHHEGRLGRMLGNAGSFLALEATVLLFALIVASPLVLLALAAWGGGRLKRRRDEERLLAVP